ncbi:MAG: copper resistance protein B [Gemmatimonadota bacterium]
MSVRRAFVGACLILMAAASEGSAQVNDTKVYTFVLADQLEFRSGGTGLFRWDVQGWVGGDYNKLWFKTEGDQPTGTGAGDAEVQALFSRLIAPFWDFQVGVRVDGVYGGDVDRTRGLLAMGVEGLAPYWFDVEAALFVSQDGDISLRASSTFDLLMSQRMIFQPRFEVNVAVQDVPEFGVGSGLNDLELGGRLRYEIRREFAPYIGISWVQRVGDTANLARVEGASTSDFSLVGGVRIWF